MYVVNEGDIWPHAYLDRTCCILYVSPFRPAKSGAVVSGETVSNLKFAQSIVLMVPRKRTMYAPESLGEVHTPVFRLAFPRTCIRLPSYIVSEELEARINLEREVG